MWRWLKRTLLVLLLLAATAGGFTLHRLMPPSVGIGVAMPAPEGALVPAAALRDGQLWVVEKETALLRRVDTSPVADGRLLVRDGIAPGEALILDPPDNLADGQALRLHP